MSENEKAHTPGPWTAICPRNRWRVMAGEVFVMESGIHGNDVRAEADAQLIASAPDLLAERDQLREQVAKLQAFKDFCHAYLDAHGVPHHPPGIHGAEGCRIGDRLDWWAAERDRRRGASC